MYTAPSNEQSTHPVAVASRRFATYFRAINRTPHVRVCVCVCLCVSVPTKRLYVHVSLKQSFLIMLILLTYFVIILHSSMFISSGPWGLYLGHFKKFIYNTIQYWVRRLKQKIRSFERHVLFTPYIHLRLTRWSWKEVGFQAAWFFPCRLLWHHVNMRNTFILKTADRLQKFKENALTQVVILSRCINWWWWLMMMCGGWNTWWFPAAACLHSSLSPALPAYASAAPFPRLRWKWWRHRPGDASPPDFHQLPVQVWRKKKEIIDAGFACLNGHVNSNNQRWVVMLSGHFGPHSTGDSVNYF